MTQNTVVSALSRIQPLTVVHGRVARCPATLGPGSSLACPCFHSRDHVAAAGPVMVAANSCFAGTWIRAGGDHTRKGIYSEPERAS